MYTLRQITKEGVQANLALGNHYAVVTKHSSPEAFERIYKDAYDSQDMVLEKGINPDCYAMIQSDLQPFIFLRNGEDNYIMTDSGKTFAKI